jgi:hypothetical protein
MVLGRKLSPRTRDVQLMVGTVKGAFIFLADVARASLKCLVGISLANQFGRPPLLLMAPLRISPMNFLARATVCLMKKASVAVP